MNAFHNHSCGLTNQSSHFVPGDQFEKTGNLETHSFSCQACAVVSEDCAKGLEWNVFSDH